MTYSSPAESGRSTIISPWLLIGPPLAAFMNILADRLTFSLSATSLRAVVAADSLIHAVTGVVLVFAIFAHRRPTRLLLFTACLTSVLVDLDHFVEAKSLNLEDALSLTWRPFLHDTFTVGVVCTLSAALCAFFHFCDCHTRRLQGRREAPVADGRADSARRGRVYMALLVTILVSVLAHHARDALRRGFWLKFTSTRPISYSEMMVIFYGLVVLGKLATDLGSGSPRHSVLMV
ncbi:transmembrane protein-like [Tropilaelaps mercedesae]|uniref:Transmembrane protein 267 n=1 Tax=Tropilaelaps mercedesae TaxID=418985 RepID=A0A1V9XD08_9ACAR|nr:transmembrane protein-like [Tropilaelaps mercedesae]